MLVVGCNYLHVCSYNDVREKRGIVVNGQLLPLQLHPTLGGMVDEIVEEDFPKNRADPDFFTFYFFIVVFPIAVLFTVAHLFLHGIPFLGIIVSVAVSVCMCRCV